jgi:7-cyano-7-deazaguanine synthase
MQKNKTAILLSGGMDSMALAYWKKPEYAITIDYGQNCAEAEIKASSFFCKELDIKHIIIHVGCSSLGSGTLSNNQSLNIAPTEEWWPYRNQLLVTLGCMKSITLGINILMIGSVRTDGQRHVDGKSEFYSKLNDLVSMQEGNIVIQAPAIEMDTIELIKKSEIPYGLLLHSHSCHRSNHPCMKCTGCYKNYMIRKQLGID